jgi:nondiscriminating glutamyl-tRNA synthetase
LPEALFNFISLLGWSPEGENEIYTREELIQVFNAKRLSRSPAVFDTDKLAWMNNHYLKKAELSRVVDLCIPHLQKAGFIPAVLDEKTKDWVTLLVKLNQEKMRYAAEIVPLSELFFKEDIGDMDEEAAALLKEEHVPIVLRSFLKQVQQSAEWSPEQIKVLLKNVQGETGYKGKQLFMSTRVALTGQMHGPDLDMTIYLLGKEKVVSRLQKLL